MLLASGDVGLERMTSLFNCIYIKYIAFEWAEMCHCKLLYKHKSEVTETGNTEAWNCYNVWWKSFDLVSKILLMQ